VIAVAAAVALTWLAAVVAGVRDLAAGEHGHGSLWLVLATVALVVMVTPERTGD
jgi:hypothetical protein